MLATPEVLRRSSSSASPHRAIRRLLEPLRFHPAFFQAVRTIFHPSSAIYAHLHFYGPILVQVTNQASFIVNHYGYHVENDLFWAGYGRGYEGLELRLWRALVPEAQFVADVGANTGIYSLAAAAINPHARIVALEPVSRIYEKLLANLALNSFNISAMRIAASDADGEAIMFDTDEEHSYSASLDPTMLEGLKTERVPVRAARLDRLFAELGWPRIDLLKIDVEKHEPAVLAGMREQLATDRPTILIEILDQDIGRAVFNLLSGLDYRFFAIDQIRGIVETTGLDQRPSCRNFLICRSQEREMIRKKIDNLEH